MAYKLIARQITDKITQTDRSILLLGPRQTGKSTLLKSLPIDLNINLARENEFLKYASQPNIFTEQIETPSVRNVFVDEIQRIPSLLNSIQAMIDDTKGIRPLRFFLSGSSARKLKRGEANLLPGRIFTYYLSGLCAKELNYKVNFNHGLRYGFLPEPYLSLNSNFSEKFLSDYSATYLKEEIQTEALTRNIQGFSRFLVTIAQASGSVIDFSKLSTKSKVSRSSCIRYVEILEDTLIAQRVNVFSQAESADCIQHPKLYFFDGGVLNGLLQNFAASDDRTGVLFEHLIYSQIRNSALAQDLPIQIDFFRTRHGLEVDFIVILKDQVWAIEAKMGEVSTSDLTGLIGFRRYYPRVDRCVIVTPKERRRQKDGILICDWVTLLEEMGL